MRLFIGLPLASEVLNELSEAVSRLKGPHDGMRWTTPASWHITLQFLGNTDQKHCDCVLACLAKIYAAPLQVRLGELGYFDRAGVFFVDVVPTPELVGLAKCVTAATAECGFLAEARPYHPHITLARVKGEERSAALKAMQVRVAPGTRFTAFMAKEYVLFESHTKPEGAQYDVRGRFLLTGKA